MSRETDIVQAFRETEGGLSELDEVDAAALESSLDAAHRLLQQLENQQPRLTALQAELLQLQHSCTPDEARALAQKSKELDQTTNVI